MKGRLKQDIDRLVKNKQLPEWFLDEKEPLECILKDSGANNVIDACYRYVRHQKGIDTTKLKELLTRSDLAKFAKARPLQIENEESLKIGYDFIHQTKPQKEIDDVE